MGRFSLRVAVLCVAHRKCRSLLKSKRNGLIFVENVAHNPLFPFVAFGYTFNLGQLRTPVISYSHTRWGLLGVSERIIVGGELFCVRASSFVGMAELRGCSVA